MDSFAPRNGPRPWRGLPGGSSGFGQRWLASRNSCRACQRAPCHEAGDDVDGQHAERDQQRAGPGQLHPIVECRGGVLVDRHRQAGHGAAQPGKIRIAERGEQQRRRLARHASDGQQHAGQQPVQRGAVADEDDGAPARRAQCDGGLAQADRDQPQHVLRRAHHDGDHQDGQRRPAGPAGKAAERRHQDLVDEQADEDGGRGEQNVGDEAHRVAQSRAAGIFGQIGPHHQPNRRADQRAKPRLYQAADDGVGQAACRAWRVGDVGKDMQAEAAHTEPEQSDQDGG